MLPHLDYENVQVRICDDVLNLKIIVLKKADIRRTICGHCFCRWEVERVRLGIYRVPNLLDICTQR